MRVMIWLGRRALSVLITGMGQDGRVWASLPQKHPVGAVAQALYRELASKFIARSPVQSRRQVGACMSEFH
jgi:chemotaxis response regulator CheB